jgi:hypothetical protein
MKINSVQESESRAFRAGLRGANDAITNVGMANGKSEVTIDDFLH